MDCLSSLTNESFPEGSTAMTSMLSFNASDMIVDKTYRFLLTVTKDDRTAQDYIDICAKEGALPLVSFIILFIILVYIQR